MFSLYENTQFQDLSLGKHNGKTPFYLVNETLASREKSTKTNPNINFYNIKNKNTKNLNNGNILLDLTDSLCDIPEEIIKRESKNTINNSGTPSAKMAKYEDKGNPFEKMNYFSAKKKQFDSKINFLINIFAL